MIRAMETRTPQVTKMSDRVCRASERKMEDFRRRPARSSSQAVRMLRSRVPATAANSPTEGTRKSVRPRLRTPRTRIEIPR